MPENDLTLFTTSALPVASDASTLEMQSIVTVAEQKPIVAEYLKYLTLAHSGSVTALHQWFAKTLLVPIPVPSASWPKRYESPELGAAPMPSARKPKYGLVATSAGNGAIHCSSGIDSACAGERVPRIKARTEKSSNPVRFMVWLHPVT